MSGIDWDEEFNRMNPETPTEKPSTSSKFSVKLGGVRRNTAALAVCGTIAVLAVCGTVVAVTNMQGEQAAQDRIRAQENAANALVEVEADKQRAQTEEATAKTLYEREMTVYLECMKIRAAAVAKAASYDIARIPGCAAPTLGGTAPRAQEPTGSAGDAITSSPWLWVALVGGAGLFAYKKLSAPSAPSISSSGSSAAVSANNKGFTFEKGA
ncbi:MULTISPECIES: hypothetical protein [unclassified Streptomyces]|uniref:hypothetical protein n=1 Tax=unclassified Streptomyces TaxID=2593676 RepID=UPI00226F3BEE|nr:MULTISPECIES: hypothetical protein [unclassified Streptomyces]MCY0923573.1 hypothetical protein [Streptomyces sp. H27-G5]MCY0962022.1 hypothetical protein [Streptomyces sp. H27-H5]